MDYWEEWKQGAGEEAVVVTGAMWAGREAEEMEGIQCLQESEFLLTSHNIDLKLRHYYIHH